ncbi:MAG: hypothetical protein KA751_06635 [Comamonas sp.]|nr:hypothetical protein [Comamonas sp.]
MKRAPVLPYNAAPKAVDGGGAGPLCAGAAAAPVIDKPCHRAMHCAALRGIARHCAALRQG